MKLTGNKRDEGMKAKLKRIFHRGLFVVMAILTGAPLAGSSTATALTTYTLTPWEYVGAAGDCGASYPAGTPGGVKSEWTVDEGDTPPALLLKKTSITPDCSSAGATINNIAGVKLTNLEFDIKG